jgi:hypothetical protein
MNRGATRLDPDVRKAFRRKGIRQPTDRPLVPHLRCGTPGRASPASRDCIHPFEQRLRLCDPEVVTANSPWELTVGPPLKEMTTVSRAVTVAR